MLAQYVRVYVRVQYERRVENLTILSSTFLWLIDCLPVKIPFSFLIYSMKETTWERVFHKKKLHRCSAYIVKKIYTIHITYIYETIRM